MIHSDLKFMFSKKATKIDEIFTVDLTLYVVNVKSTVKISSVFVAFLENMNFKRTLLLEKQNSINWVGKKKPTVCRYIVEALFFTASINV